MPNRPRHTTLLPEYALLGFLSQHAAHGYELHQQLYTHLGQIWHVSLSQVYNILNRLEAQGYVTGTVQEQEKLPDRRRFRLTPAGRGRFESWLYSTSGCSVRAVRVEFTTRLFFCQSIGPDACRGLVEAQTAETQACLVRLRAMLADLPPEQKYNRLGAELRIRQLTSLLGWIADSVNLLDL